MLKYDDDNGMLTFSTGKSVYCFGGNPSIAFNLPETTHYAYGSDGDFDIRTDNYNCGEITISEALEIADTMIEAWNKHKQYILTLAREPQS